MRPREFQFVQSFEGRPCTGAPLGAPTTLVSMVRPTRFEHNRYLGDKRTQRVYDLDDPTLDKAIIDELVSSGQAAAFGPDTLAEARNRNYKLSRQQRAAMGSSAI